MLTHDKTPIVIGIIGGSGSGKTTFARRLCERLAPDVAVLSHDDYYKHLPDMTREVVIPDAQSDRALAVVAAGLDALR